MLWFRVCVFHSTIATLSCVLGNWTQRNLMAINDSELSADQLNRASAPFPSLYPSSWALPAMVVDDVPSPVFRELQSVSHCLVEVYLHVANIIRFAGNNYTGGFCNIQKAIEKIQGKADDDLLAQYAWVMLIGAPAHFVAKSSHENAMLHWQIGNHPSVDQDLEKATKAMAKLVQHHFTVPLESWIARFVPHLFLNHAT